MNDELSSKIKKASRLITLYKVMYEDLNISNEEFKDLLDYYASIEEYELCKVLIRKRKEI